ncbi:MAG: hypothetical protein LIR50_17165 [Bacillota bacterium]|nr:hypothetical protein [Bacillota bacterium]
MKRNMALSLVLIILILIPINAFASGVNKNAYEKKQSILSAKGKMAAVKKNLINEKEILKQISKKNKQVKSLLNEKNQKNNFSLEEKQAILNTVKDIKQQVGYVKIPVSDIKIMWYKAKANNKIRSYKELSGNLDDIIKLQNKKMGYLNKINQDFDELIKLLET